MPTAIPRRIAPRFFAIKRRPHLASVSLAAALLLLAVTGMILIGFGVSMDRAFGKPPTRIPAAPDVNAPPVPELFRLQGIAPRTAVAINAGLPVSKLPNPAARPFLPTAGSATDRERAIACLASAIYYEAATEPVDGQRAVAQVVLNRVRHPAYPSTVCGVVYQGLERKTGCQFTFTCDGSLARAPMAWYWNRALRIAEDALAGGVYKPVGWATHYHTNAVIPYWSSSLVKVAVVGTHIFYRWTGNWGTGPSFQTRYAGIEPEVSRWRQAALANSAAKGEQKIMTDFPLRPHVIASPIAPSSADGLFQAAVQRSAQVSDNEAATASASTTRKRDAVAAGLRWKLTKAPPAETPRL